MENQEKLIEIEKLQRCIKRSNIFAFTMLGLIGGVMTLGAIGYMTDSNTQPTFTQSAQSTHHTVNYNERRTKAYNAVIMDEQSGKIIDSVYTTNVRTNSYLRYDSEGNPETVSNMMIILVDGQADERAKMYQEIDSTRTALNEYYIKQLDTAHILFDKQLDTIAAYKILIRDINKL